MAYNQKIIFSSIQNYLIGGLDAWIDDLDKISQSFIPISQFTELAENDRCFLCGRRGSGKSAIAIMTKIAKEWDIHQAIRGEKEQYGDYTPLVDDLVGRQMSGFQINIREFIRLVWRYCLRIVILQTLFVNRNELNAQGNLIIMIKNYLSKIGYLDKPIGEILCDIFQKSISSISYDHIYGAAEMFSYIQKRIKDENFREVISYIPKILGKKRILIVFDTIESFTIYTEGMKYGLQGIIESIYELLHDSTFDNIGIRFFIPAEILEEVTSMMPAKTLSRTVILRWLSGDLMTMLSKRYLDMIKRNELINTSAYDNLDKLVQSSVNQTGSMDGRKLREEFWYQNSFLPRKIVNRMKQEEDCFGYLFRHTQRRPRELILIFNSIIHKAYKRNELPKISNDSVVEGVHNPIILAEMVRDTLSPFDNYIDKIVDKAKSALFMRPRIIDGRDLKRFTAIIYELDPRTDLTKEWFLIYLLRAGVIGIVPESKSRDVYTIGMFEYLMQDKLPYSPHLTYCVHPTFGDFLKMPFENTTPIYPVPEEDSWLEKEIGIPIL